MLVHLLLFHHTPRYSVIHLSIAGSYRGSQPYMNFLFDTPPPQPRFKQNWSRNMGRVLVGHIRSPKGVKVITSPHSDLNHVKNLQSILSKRPARVGGTVHTQTATLGGSLDVLQRSSSKNLPKTDKISGYENCEAAVKCNVKTGVTCSDGLGWHFLTGFIPHA